MSYSKETAIILSGIVAIIGILVEAFDVYEKSKLPVTQKGYTKIAYSVCKKECVEFKEFQPIVTSECNCLDHKNSAIKHLKVWIDRNCVGVIPKEYVILEGTPEYEKIQKQKDKEEQTSKVQ